MSKFRPDRSISRILSVGIASVALAACGGVETASSPTGGPLVGGSQPPPATAPINRAPQITGNPPGTVTAGQAYSFVPTASDPDGNSLAFSVTGKPAWLAFNTTTGALSGTPTAADAGQSTIAITASDGSLQAALTFALTVVAPANRPPTISGNGTGALLVGQPYAFTPTASDPDGDRLTFDVTGKPAWAAFDAATGRLSGTPGANDVGTSNVTISVSDGVAQASIGFSIVVSTTAPPPPPSNRAPTISGNGAATVTTGQAYSFTPTASDPDGNALTFAISGRPSWATFSTTTGRLQGTPGVGNVGASTVTIAVSDGSLSAAVTFTITVIAGNRAPTISGNGTRSVAVGQAYSFTPTASDPDGNPLTFSATGRPAWLAFNASTGALTGTPGAGDVGSSTITITVSDGTLSSSLSATVTVTAANRAPTISGNGTQTVAVGQAYAFTPTASDPDGNPLTFSASGTPAWLSFNTANGALSGTPAAGDTGASTITITVSDGTLSSSLTATVTVTAANRAPTISGNGTRTVTVGQAYSFTPTASDPDGNPLTFAVTGRPAWLSFNATNGALTGTPGAGDVGNSTVTITVSDGTLSATLSATITVAAVATGSATLNWTPPTTRADGSALSNLASYRVYYGTQSGSLSTRIDVSNPGVSSYVVTNLAPGTWFFAVTAVDSSGAESDRSNVASLTVN
jgi:VCBS repeat-containing protein